MGCVSGGIEIGGDELHLDGLLLLMRVKIRNDAQEYVNKNQEKFLPYSLERCCFIWPMVIHIDLKMHKISETVVKNVWEQLIKSINETQPTQTFISFI